jgi:hypothetical protein
MGFASYDVRDISWSNDSFEDTYTPLQLYYNGTDPFRSHALLQCIATNNDTVPAELHVVVVDDNEITYGTLATIAIPAGSGYGTAPPVDVLASMIPPVSGPQALPPLRTWGFFLIAAPSAGMLVQVSRLDGIF